MVAILGGATAVASAQYTAYDLGLGRACAINAAGTVVGRGPIVYADDRSSFSPLSWSGGVSTDLGSLGGSSGIASAINDAGEIAGWSEVNDSATHGFRHSSGTMADLGVIEYNSFAFGINNAGVIVGESVLGGSTRAFIYENGVMSDLGSLGGIGSCAIGINGAGTVVGWSDNARGVMRAFSCAGGVFTELGTLGDTHSASSAADINEAGLIVGSSEISYLGPRHAVLFQEGAVIDLGTLGGANSGASAINSAGVIVGYAEAGPWDRHAFVYCDGVMVDLDPLLAQIGLTGGSSAADINDLGEIVGTAYDADGQEHAFLLRVPEPSAIALLVSGLALLRLRRHLPVQRRR